MTLAIVLLGLGLALVVAEVLFPSFGVLGTLASLSVIAACVLAFRESTELGINFLIAVAALVPVLIMGGLKYFPHSPVGKRMVVDGFSFEDGEGTDSRNPGLLGREGVVEAALHPAGMARIDGRRVDVVSRGGLIENGVRVRVVEVEGNRVVVETIDVI